jgi:hypothetical protein
MRRTVFIMLAASFLLSPAVALAQQSGGTGNGSVAKSGAPTIEDDIDYVYRAIDKAKEDKAISEHKAHSDERKLKAIEHKLAHLSKEVSQIRLSIQ